MFDSAGKEPHVSTVERMFHQRLGSNSDYTALMELFLAYRNSLKFAREIIDSEPHSLGFSLEAQGAAASEEGQPASVTSSQLSAGAIPHVTQDDDAQLMLADEPAAASGSDAASEEIPTEFRSRPMRYVEAGKLLGWTGTPESIGRRFNRNKKQYPRIKRSKDEFVFDVRAFPASVQQGMLPRA